MAGIPPGAPIAPGIVPANSNTYPQYGVGGGTPGNAAGWNIVTANSSAEKTQDIQKGYVAWFSSQQAAQNFLNEETNPLSAGTAPLPTLWSLIFRNTSGLLTRFLKVVIGGTLLLIGIAHMTGASEKLPEVLARMPV